VWHVSRTVDGTAVAQEVWYVGKRGLFKLTANDEFTLIDAELTPWADVERGLTARQDARDREPVNLTLTIGSPTLRVSARVLVDDRFFGSDPNLPFIRDIQKHLPAE
jgi:hypothetical protein